MVAITLPDGSVRRYDGAVTGARLAADIGPGLAKAALAMRVDGDLWDLTRELAADAKVRTDRRTGKQVRYSPTAARMKGLGLRNGVPDILIACRGADPSYIGFALELKSATGTLRPEQKVWRDRLIGAGWYWVLSRDFDHARGEIARYFNTKP